MKVYNAEEKCEEFKSDIK